LEFDLIGLGIGIEQFPGKGSGIVIPTTGPDSFGDGASLVSWLEPDTGVTLSGSNLASIVDNAALAQGALWTANVNMTPASDLNGKNRWNCNASDSYLTRDDGGASVTKGWVMGYYIRMFTSSGVERVPYGIDSTDREDGLGAVSTNYLLDQIAIGNGVDSNADLAGTASITSGTHYLQVVTYTKATGEIRCYQNAVDITIGTPHTLSTGLSFTYNTAWAAGKATAGQWNCGTALLYNAVPTNALINEVGQYMSDLYGLGQSWSIS
jgi:hypothetical protein